MIFKLFIKISTENSKIKKVRICGYLVKHYLLRTIIDLSYLLSSISVTCRRS